MRIHYILLLTLFLLFSGNKAFPVEVKKWEKAESNFTSSKVYDNPIYDISHFYAVFVSPTGREMKINGFWDGGKLWKIRFSPDETGIWEYTTKCSDKSNTGLHNLVGKLECIANNRKEDIYSHGPIKRSPGKYYLTHQNGTPFFWTACTAWNGALKSTDEEWDKYLSNRKINNYNVIQFVATQWRGCDKNSEGQVAYTGTGRIMINPVFFQHLDKKVDKINEYGLVAAPVLLWALPKGAGMHLSPGYSLPLIEAVLLAKYIVARYGGNQVVWILGGDGAYINEYEQRWKEIGRRVFGEQHPGLVAQHPMGRSWIGEIYKEENWLDIVGYQSSHSNQEGTVNWITKGPMATTWDKLPPKPIINLEPNYEEIGFRISAEDVRNASYWSVFATPPSGITYGADGIWPWIRPGEFRLNHGNPADKQPTPWYKSIDFPGSKQIGYLSGFIQSLPWWELTPAQELLQSQPGDSQFNKFVSVLKNDDYSNLIFYFPAKQEIKIRNQMGYKYKARWFDPVSNKYNQAQIKNDFKLIKATPPIDQDMILILEKIN